jgi:hypothetical protein
MKTKHTHIPVDNELPRQFIISYDTVYSANKKYADKKYEKHPFHKYAKQMMNEIHKYRN